MKTSIINGKVILKDQIINKVVVFENGKIIDICDQAHENSQIIDAKGNYVSPGFIDTHVHGRNGSDSMYPTFKDINNISKSLATQGTTTFLPTTITQSFENIHNALKNINESKDKVEGARIYGVHLEGPFFNKQFKGAQPEQYCINPSIESYEAFVGEYQDLITLISLAPELEGTEELVPYLIDKGVVVSMGHTGATYDQAKKGVELGITRATHTYNGMLGFNHREPGTVGAVYDFDQLYAELILDGVHVHFAAARSLFKNKGKDKMVLITDCLEAGGLPNGDYNLGGQTIHVHDGQARLDSGTLAGSTAGMCKVVYNAWKHLNVELYDAVNFATYNVAKSLNIDNIGEIAIGKLADIILFNEDMDIEKVIIGGKEIL